MDMLLYVSVLVVGTYVFIIFSFALGWKKIIYYRAPEEAMNQPVSIIIAFRNEEKNINLLLNCLLNQEYPKQNMEILLVDDHSSDNSVRIVESFLERTNPIKLLKLPANLKGKKAAIEYGVSQASAELIISTDADCTMTKHWLKTMVSYYHKNNAKLISGPVAFNNNHFFQEIQALEFLSLIGTGAGAIGIQRPIMSNGANLLFEKKVFLSSVLNKKYASGDDIFLLLHAKKSFRKDIHFIKSQDAIVYSTPPVSFSNFLDQRVRWTSKSKSYRDFDIVFTALAVSLTNLILITCLILTLFSPQLFTIYLTLFIIKCLVDLSILIPVTKFTNQQKLLWYFIPLQFIYPFYIILTVILGLTGKFKWKNRFYKENR